jgi:hypothetical protein
VVLLARHHADEATEPSPGFERVGAGERRAEQRQETIEEAVVLDEIARHHRIGHGSGEQLVDEAMPHGIRPGRLARSAQYLGEAFRHVGPHLAPYGLLRAGRPRWWHIETVSAGLRYVTGDARRHERAFPWRFDRGHCGGKFAVDSPLEDSPLEEAGCELTVPP